MQETYINNKGITKTVIQSNQNRHVNEMKWDAKYNGDIANIKLDINENGKNNHYDLTFDNEDLANILNVATINEPIHNRLKKDFSLNPRSKYITDKRNLVIEIDPKSETSNLFSTKEDTTTRETDEYKDNRYISSPDPNEELIIPLNIANKSYNKYSLKKRRRKRPKTLRIKIKKGRNTLRDTTSRNTNTSRKIYY